MPIPRHRLLVVLLTTSLCINIVLSQDLRPFESEISSPSHLTNRNYRNTRNTNNNNEDFDNLIVSNQSEARNSEAGDDDASEDEGEGDDNGGGSGGGGGDEGSNDDEGEEDDSEGQEEEAQAQASVSNLQYALPFANFTELAYHPDTNVSASSIIYRTKDLDTAATG